MKTILGILALALLAVGCKCQQLSSDKISSVQSKKSRIGYCQFDGPVTLADYFVPSQKVNGDCHDTGISVYVDNWWERKEDHNYLGFIESREEITGRVQVRYW